MPLPLADYHTHTPLCLHAEGTPLEYAQHAKEVGLAEIGFSDHNPMPEFLDDWRMPIQDLPSYIDQIVQTREEMAPFPVKIGLECDYLETQTAWIDTLATRFSWDYLIGAVHYIAPGWDVDNPKWIGRFTSDSVEDIWVLYFSKLEACIRTRRFDLIAHADLVKKFGHRPAGDLRRFYDPIIEAALETGVAMEVSTAGLRKPVNEMYPSLLFLEQMKAANIPISISSDAHAPAEVGADFDQAFEMIRSLGFTSTVRFNGRTRHLVPLE